jgi:hypothetical protein
MSHVVAAIALALSALSAPAAPPGTIIHHIPASSGIYVGSPSLAVLTNGSYVASHDEFGPKSTEHTKATTSVFSSFDKGKSWRRISDIHGQFWSTLFVHHGVLFIIGTDRHHGDAIIRRSLDGGVSWTDPTNAQSGLLRGDGQYHCAPMQVLEHRGRLWRPMERRNPPSGWGITYCAGLMSAPVEADLLDSANWTFSNFLPGNTNWLSGKFGGWLEGNAVVARDGQLLDVLRVETPDYPERAALVRASADGRTLSFDPHNGFVTFPGGAKKFTIRHDEKSDRYWSLATFVPDRFQTKTRPARTRNTLGLVCSKDMSNWEIRCTLLQHPDTAKHGFQYVDWLVQGEDIIAVCRTAFDDGEGGAHNNHDANFLTFHRFADFRQCHD